MVDIFKKGEQMSKCKHCEFLDKIFDPILKSEDSTNREFWIFTEMFVYLHDGKDYCDKGGSNE